MNCEARTANGPCRQPHARIVEFSRPFHPDEPRSEGAAGHVIDPVLCTHHRAQLARWADGAKGRSALVLVAEVWGIER